MYNNRNNGNSRRIGGISLLVLLMIAAILFAFVLNDRSVKNQYNLSSFKEDILDEKVESVEIRQNEAAPTGRVIVSFKKSSREDKTFYVPETQKIVDLLDELNFDDYVVKNID